ncbi:MAG: class I SAM-dependent methyltransferase [Acidimicrobiales bacterium]
MTLPTGDDPGSWDGYLRRFHEERSGITEDLLSRGRSHGVDPYAWCAAALVQPGTARVGAVLDLACGSGPLADHLAGWVGLDRSRAELDRAAGIGRAPLVCGSATAVPLRDGAAAAVACTMGLQTIEPLEAGVAEVARLLRPAGRAVLLLPAGGPLPPVAIATYLWLQVVLRQRIRYPNDAALRPAPLEALVARHGLEVEDDQRRRFRVPVESADVVALFVRSLYLPGHRPDRERQARRALSWRIGRHLDIPLRRVVLRRTSASQPAGALER